jgi:hypothetical protein
MRSEPCRSAEWTMASKGRKRGHVAPICLALFHPLRSICCALSNFQPAADDSILMGYPRDHTEVPREYHPLLVQLLQRWETLAPFFGAYHRRSGSLESQMGGTGSFGHFSVRDNGVVRVPMSRSTSRQRIGSDRNSNGQSGRCIL